MKEVVEVPAPSADLVIGHQTTGAASTLSDANCFRSSVVYLPQALNEATIVAQVDELPCQLL